MRYAFGSRSAAFGLLIGTLLFASGCGSGVYPVKGAVQWKNGNPAKELAGSNVVFELAEKKTSSRGVIQADGTFKLTTLQPDDGAPIGEHKVFIVEDRKNANAEGTQLLPALLDPRYSEAATSTLKANVTSGPNDITLTVERASK